MRKIKAIFIFFFGVNFLVAGNLFYQNQDFSQIRNPFSLSKLIKEKKESVVSLKKYLLLVSNNPSLLKKWIKTKTNILKRMQDTAYKKYSQIEIENWLNKIVKNKNFQKAFYYLFIERDFYKQKNKNISLPNFEEGFKYLSKAILETNNPIASYIGTEFLYFGFSMPRNLIAIKYSKLFSEPLYLTNKSCLGYYMYGESYFKFSNHPNYQKAYNILDKGYKKCKKLEKGKGISHIIAYNLRFESAKVKAYIILNNRGK